MTPSRPQPGSTGAPLLDGARVRLDARALQSLLLTLARGAEGKPGAASLAGFEAGEAEACALLEAVLRDERQGVGTIASRRGADAEALTAVAGLAALPPMHACWRKLESRVPVGWSHGWCPCCGAWPVMAELRGLDRARLLRCGRCGGAWSMLWLRCAFCGEGRHEKLGSLVPEGELESRRVETCLSCRSYLKSIATLQASPAVELLLRDLETVELDLVALRRGFTRPTGPGAAPDLRIQPLDASSA